MSNHFIIFLNTIRPALIVLMKDQTFLVTLVGSYIFIENFHGFVLIESYLNELTNL
jgi:hypothetical protein